METILIYSENIGLAKELLTAGRSLGSATALAMNNEVAEALTACGADVVSFEGTGALPADTAAMAQVVAMAADRLAASVVLLGSDRRGKELAGRLASKLGAGCLTDVKAMALEGDTILCTRLTFGGATISTEKINSPKKVIALSPSVYVKAEQAPLGSVSSFSGPVEARIKLLSEREKIADTVDLKAADVIVAIGEGVEPEAVAPAEQLAQALGGVLACSKPTATDRGLLSEERVIGLSGTICKPDLAVVIGISGQAQFSVGVRDAKVIVTVNTDKNADMVRMSDYFIVKDSSEAIAELCTLLT